MAAGNGHTETSDTYWVAYLAAAIGGALVTKPWEHARGGLERALRDFTKARACSTELRDMIAKIQKGETL
jgi:hypothetical protein